MKLKTTLIYIAVWFGAIILISSVAISNLPWQGTFIGGKLPEFRTNPQLLWRANFDGNHYVYISQFGYGYGQRAFFPMYPSLIRWVRNTFQILPATQFRASTIIGVTISTVSFMVACVFLVKLVELDYSHLVSKNTLLVLLAFPTSFFFVTAYTEGLFFMLVVASFFFARTRRWWLACVLAALAGYTKFMGLALLPALAVEYFQQTTTVRTGNRLKGAVPLLLIPLGLGIYMYQLFAVSGDPLLFLHSLPLYGTYRSDHVILLYQVFWRYAKMIAGATSLNTLYTTVFLEAGVGIVFLVLGIYSFIKQRLSYALFNFAAYVVPTLTGSFVSLPRYVLICFPALVILAQLLTKRPYLKRLYLVVSVLLAIIFLSLFSTGFWVA